MQTNTESNSKIYAYKVRYDSGAAPCVHEDILSLCICKSALRRVAQPGDWIIGVGASSDDRLQGRVIYIAKVTQALAGPEYYDEDGKWAGRPDCIYQYDADKKEYRQKDNPFHGIGEMHNDLGAAPGYNNSRCLVSDHFAYFGGGDGPSIDQIEDIVKPIMQGHRVWHDANDEAYARLAKFISDAMEKHGCGKHGEPTHGPKSTGGGC